MKLTVILATVLPGATPLAAQRMEELMARANAAGDSGRHAEAARLFEQLHAVTGFDPVLLYVAATSAARAGDRATVFRHLRRAVDDGFPHIDRLQRDTIFVAFQVDTAWKALLAHAVQRSAGYDQALRAELLELAANDQRNRAGIDEIVSRHGRSSAQADSAFAALDAADAPLQARLREIIAKRGWPHRLLVADDGAHAAWLIVQHAAVEYQRQVLPLLRAAVQAGHARPADAAMLEDRVLVADGKPQRYGTQMKWPTGPGTPTLLPIEDEACVERRRAQVGLEPLADNLARFGIRYAPPRSRCER